MSTLPDQPNFDSGSFSRGIDPESDQATQDFRPLLFRRYQVRRELGRGGMGVVVLAHDTALDIPVAVKLVPEMVVKDTEAIADLRKEVLRGMALMHPAVVRTTNFERDEGGAGIVMEFVEGDTLAGLKQRQPQNCFDPEQILPWIEELCAVLDYAHREAHIIHRDLKPRNLMITKAGKLKVADFGIAATLSDSVSRHSMEGVTSGTPSYMSPQQAQGLRPSHLDDIHALGATIYELLTSKPPFFRGNATAIFGQVLQVVPPSMAERRKDLDIAGKAPIPAEWEETIAACLAKEPAQRPQSAGEVLARLRAPASTVHAPVSLGLGEEKKISHLQGVPSGILPEGELTREAVEAVRSVADRNALGASAKAAMPKKSSRLIYILLLLVASGFAAASWVLNQDSKPHSITPRSATPDSQHPGARRFAVKGARSEPIKERFDPSQVIAAIKEIVPEQVLITTFHGAGESDHCVSIEGIAVSPDMPRQTAEKFRLAILEHLSKQYRGLDVSFSVLGDHREWVELGGKSLPAADFVIRIRP